MKRFRLAAYVLIAALVAAPCTAVLAQNYYNPGYSSQTIGTYGVIAVVNGTNIKLQNGRNIFLKNGTVISPRGTRLIPGMHISVQGTHGGNHAINATYVRVYAYGTPGYYNYGR